VNKQALHFRSIPGPVYGTSLWVRQGVICWKRGTPKPNPPTKPYLVNSSRTVAEASLPQLPLKPTMTRWAYFVRMAAMIAGFFCLAMAFCSALSEPEDSIALAALLATAFKLRWTYSRFRDAGYSGWYCLLSLVPLVGTLVTTLVYFIPTNYRQTRQKDGWMVLGLSLCGIYLAVIAVSFWLCAHPDISDTNSDLILIYC